MASSVIELIKVLRERTGAGNMDCKKALEECGMDVEKAVDYLREKGIVKAAKKASRIAAEGMTDIKEHGNKAVIVEVNCETDFVAKGKIFGKLVSDLSQLVLTKDFGDIDSAREAAKSILLDASIALGEKLDFRRFKVVEKNSHEHFGTYIHNGSKIGVIVVLDKKDDEVAQGLAMHIAANAPIYICKHCIPNDVREHERKIALEVAKDDPKLQGKPESALKNIIDGKVNKILSEQTLLEQMYLMSNDETVGQYLEKKKINVLEFVRYLVGEGIEKRRDDFACEVMSQNK